MGISHSSWPTCITNQKSAWLPAQEFMKESIHIHHSPQIYIKVKKRTLSHKSDPTLHLRGHLVLYPSACKLILHVEISTEVSIFISRCTLQSISHQSLIVNLCFTYSNTMTVANKPLHTIKIQLHWKRRLVPSVLVALMAPKCSS